MEEEDYEFLRADEMAKDRPIDREAWLREVFPEWKFYLNHEIENTDVQPNTVVLWWLGACGFFVKTPEAIFLIDNYSGPSLTTHYEYDGVCKTTGARSLNWIRINPHVIDPFDIEKLDALLVTHEHADHCDIYTIKAVLQNTAAFFIGPERVCEKLRKYGVSEDRIIKVKPGDRKQIKDTEIVALESYDEMAKRTGRCSMEEAAVTYFLNTRGGSIFHIGDSIYSNHYYRIGREYKIDIALINMGSNPPGVTDKLTVFDAYRIAKMLRAKVAIPMHYDNWAITQEDPTEFERIMRERAPNIKTVIMQWGGKFQYPQDQGIGRYKYSQQEEKFNPELSLEYGPQRKLQATS